MGIIRERLTELAKRCGDLTPIQNDVRQILVNGNRERALAGTNAQGVPFASLAPSTLKHRRGKGPPQAPRGAGSQIVTGYVVQVTAGPGELRIIASWPDLPWIPYHVDGTPHMPARNPMGYRQQDLEKIRALMNGYVMGWGARARRFASSFVGRAAAL